MKSIFVLLNTIVFCFSVSSIMASDFSSEKEAAINAALDSIDQSIRNMSDSEKAKVYLEDVKVATEDMKKEFDIMLRGINPYQDCSILLNKFNTTKRMIDYDVKNCLIENKDSSCENITKLMGIFDRKNVAKAEQCANDIGIFSPEKNLLEKHMKSLSLINKAMLMR